MDMLKQFDNTIHLDIENLKSENFLGLHNLAGNVREWTMNPDIGFPKNRAILGGSFLDETYLYNDFYTQSVLDRSDGNGIRLVYNFNEKEDQSSYGVEVRDFINSPDVTDEVFEYIFRKDPKGILKTRNTILNWIIPLGLSIWCFVTFGDPSNFIYFQF